MYSAYQTLKKHEKNGEVPETGEKPEECAVMEAKGREHFKDWLKLYNGQEQKLSIEFKQQRGCTGKSFSTCQTICKIYDTDCSGFKEIKSEVLGTSLVAQWLRICLPMQGTWVQSLVWEDPTCLGATKAMCHTEPAL